MKQLPALLYPALRDNRSFYSAFTQQETSGYRRNRCINCPFLCLLNALSLGLMIFFMSTQSVAAHSQLPSQAFAIPILATTESGPYQLSAIQYAANDFWVVEVSVEMASGATAVGTQARATIISTQTGTEEAIRLLRYQDRLIARLPLIEDSWDMTITVSSDAGDGQVAFRTVSHAGATASSPLVQGVVIAVPFLLIAIGLFVYKRFGLSLVQ